MRFTLVILLTVAYVANAGVLKKEKKCVCNPVNTVQVVRSGLKNVYCARLKKDSKLTSRKFLKDYFNEQAKGGCLPRAALRKNLLKAVRNDDSVTKHLKALRTPCVKQLKKLIDENNDGKVSRKEFVEYFHLLMKNIQCKNGAKSEDSKGKNCLIKVHSSSKGKNGGECDCMNGGVCKCKKGGICKCNMKVVKNVVVRAFQKLYCDELKKTDGLQPKKFLRDYFNKYKTKKGFLPKRALRENLMCKLPKNSKLRQRLDKIKPQCIRALKRRMDTNMDFKVTEFEFILFMLPNIKKSNCFKSKYISAIAILYISTGEVCPAKAHSSKLRPKKWKKGQKCKGCNMKKLKKTVITGFQMLYCYKLKKHPAVLSRKKFLNGYFSRFKTRKGYLPRRALRRILAQQFPRGFLIRKRLFKLKKKCVRVLKLQMDSNHDSKVSRKEFVRYMHYKINKSRCRKNKNWFKEC